MDSDEQRDLAEELDNAMIPFKENMTQIFPSTWNLDDLLNFARLYPPTIDEVNGEIVLCTGLQEAPDKSLWTESKWVAQWISSTD